MNVKLEPILFFCLSFFLFFSAPSFSNCPNWDDEKRKVEMHTLEEKLMQLNHDYWENGISSVSDEIYDQLKEHYRFLENCFQSKADFTLTDKIEQPLLASSAQSTLTHPIVHVGVKKIYSKEQAIKWFNQRKQVWLQPKIDGVAITLVYQNGQLISAISRGDNELGQNWLSAILKANHIPNQINTNEKEIILQGEIFWKVENHIQSQDDSLHYRTKVATLLMQNNPDQKQLDHLYFWVWEWANGAVKMSDRLAGLKKMGFYYGVVDSHWVESDADLLKWRQYYYEQPQDYATDGIVLKEEMRLPANQWQKKAPYWQIAWKHPAKKQLTTIKSIDYSIGRSGKITPYLVIEPTQIDKKTFRKVSLHSLKTLEKADLAVGDLISIRLSGDSIPLFDQVILRHAKRQQNQFPDQKQYHSLSCLNYSPECEAQFTERLRYLVGKNGLNLNLSFSSLQTLIRTGTIKSLNDFTKPNDEQLISIFNWNQAALKKWQDAISIVEQKTVNDWLIGYGLKELTFIDKSTLNKKITVQTLHQCDLNWLNEMYLKEQKLKFYRSFFTSLNDCNFQNET